MIKLHHVGIIGALSLAACGDPGEDHDGEGNDQEVITTVRLTFTPDGGEAFTASFADPENDGSPTIDPITLTEGVSYGLSVAFLNELESPAEDITEEVADEADQHQVFFTGDALTGALVSHVYDDEDGGGLPIGLSNTLSADAAGSGDLVVTLRHLPPESGSAVKVAGLAETVASEGFSAIGGDNDAQVTFEITVEAADL